MSKFNTLVESILVEGKVKLITKKIKGSPDTYWDLRAEVDGTVISTDSISKDDEGMYWASELPGRFKGIKELKTAFLKKVEKEYNQDQSRKGKAKYEWHVSDDEHKLVDTKTGKTLIQTPRRSKIVNYMDKNNIVHADVNKIVSR